LAAWSDEVALPLELEQVDGRATQLSGAASPNLEHARAEQADTMTGQERHEAVEHVRREPTGALALEVLCRGARLGHRQTLPRECRQGRRLLLDGQERLVAAYVALGASLLLGAVLAAPGGCARIGEPRLVGRTVERLRCDRLLDEHERTVLGELQIALGLGEA